MDSIISGIITPEILSIFCLSKNFSLDAMTIKLGKILDNYVPEFPSEVKLKLPKLKKVGDKKELPKIKLPKLKKVKGDKSKSQTTIKLPKLKKVT